MTLSSVLTAARRWRSTRLSELGNWLAIPSVSAEPARAADVARAARWLASWQRAHGASVRLQPTSHGRHVVIADWSAPPGAPLVVIYGHYDVQPAGPGWSSDPFTPFVRNRVLYARGAGDDKGQLFAHLCALAAWRQAGVPPARTLVIAEGAEEVGSPGFGDVLLRLAERYRPRAVVVSDTERYDDGTPTVTLSQRGHLVGQLEVDTGGSDVHPGRLGGAVVDSGLVLAESLLALRDELVASLRFHSNDGAIPLRCRSDAAIAWAAGGRATVGAGLDRRVTRSGNLGITRLTTGGRGGALPARSTARIDLRLPPRVDPAVVLARARHLLRRITPPGTTVRLRVATVTPGVELTPDATTQYAMERACIVGFGRPPAYVRSGGTVPAVAMMARIFGIRPVLLGFGTPFGHAHGPNEAMDLSGWAASIDTSVAMLPALARPICLDQVSQRRLIPHDGGRQPDRTSAPLAGVHGKGW